MEDRYSIGDPPDTKCFEGKYAYISGTPSSRHVRYRNTIACLPPGEQIFVFFEKIRFAYQKLNFSNFCVFNKKNQ
jgi:hypothetical protein